MVAEKSMRDTLTEEQCAVLFSELDKGIDDMEEGRILPHEEAMQRIREAVHAYGV